MKTRTLTHAMTCTGAVIGAGFASGREIASFFSIYGMHGWWLIALACAVMTSLCMVCMRETIRCGAECWCDLYHEEQQWLKKGIQLCTSLLMVITSGAMIAASGQMVALIWNYPWAYAIGAAATFAAAWLLGYGSMRPLGWLSGVLIVVFLAALMMGLSQDGAETVSLVRHGSLVMAAIRAASYAAMNLTLAIGVVCRCAQADNRENTLTALSFGILMFVTMSLSHCLYSRHPEWLGDGFPLVRNLSVLGRKGFLFGAALIYLSVFTSLTAVIYALRCAVEKQTDSLLLRTLAVVVLPVAVSCIGFVQIVDRFYAPSGLICLIVVFYPLCRRRSA